MPERRPTPRRGGTARGPRLIPYVAAAAVAVGLGYLVGMALRESPEQNASPEASVAVPLYKKFDRPLTQILVEREPIFPDPIEELASLELRPYEEALPDDVYEGPTGAYGVDGPPSAPEPFLPPRPAPAEDPGAEEPSAVALLGAAPGRKPAMPGGEMPPPKAAPVTPVYQDLFPLSPPTLKPGEAPPPADVPEPQVASLPPGAVPVYPPGERGRARVAIVIDDLGIDKRRTRKVIGLPGPLSLAFLTYAPGLADQTASARTAGHELLVHVPMQPRNGKLDPGPRALTVGLAEKEIRSRLDWALSRFEGFVGINNHMGSRFTADGVGMAVVMAELKDRGLFFLDSRTSGTTKGPEAARRNGVPFVSRNVFLDNVNDPSAVRRQVAVLERVARRRGAAVAIGHPKDATIAVLTRWLSDLENRGLILVPVSRLVRVAG